ncbi:MAG: 5-deoxy-glucuronate isomerase [Spirochaetota bacterium]
MPKHIPNYDNQNQAIVGPEQYTLERSYFNRVILSAGTSYRHELPGFESCLVVAYGTCDIEVNGEGLRQKFDGVGQRRELFTGKPDSVYVPLGTAAQISAAAPNTEIYIAAGRARQVYPPFRIEPEEVDVVQYGSDETKTHRKIYHVLGKNQNGKVDKLLVSELFTVGAGGWSGFPPHKHHQDRSEAGGVIETDHEEIYHFKFNPPHGFGAQFAYVDDQDYGPVYHLKDASTVLLDKGYHPAVAAPGYEMYYFTILVGKSRRPLVQYFEPRHSYQLKTIPGIMDMVNKFK